MIFISAFIGYIAMMLSIKELKLVSPFDKKMWFKIFAIGLLCCGISLMYREISTILLLLSILIILVWGKNGIINSLISETIAMFIAFLLDLLVSPLFIKVVNNEVLFGDKEQLVVAIINSLLAVIISKCINYVLEKMKRTLKNIGHIKDIIDMKKCSTIIFCIIILFIFILNIYATRGVNNKADFVYLSVIISISYFVVFGVIAIIIYKNLKNEVLADAKERQLKDVREYSENLEILYNDMRKFKHDYVNILSSMAGYIEDTDMSGLRDYFEKKIVPLGTDINEKNSRIGLLHNINIKEIKGVVLTKVLRAQELNINVYIDISEEINSINIDIVDLSRCIGILLDNAIESAINCINGEIKIGFIKKNNSIVMAIMNSIENDIPPIYKIYEKGFSTKGDNRGIGLSNLREILSKYSHITIDTIIEENEFKQILEIC
ncbi:GHKL domain-containing protein [Clostridium sp. SHJSY1]|uniref:sensor histidine kinase n=1 Tax=Clostridium sp. SHJSY1 TaxID=2942483 RepID=UPI0028747A7F|nr:GHKL domain-containing protein [Clostridium sp. SHJSY1]MDS0527508.1 GHKL domain-containing protein [Clostridium sp. SHJSY1]